MSRRVLNILILLVVVVACGGGGGDSEDSTTANTEATTTSTTQVTTTGTTRAPTVTTRASTTTTTSSVQDPLIVDQGFWTDSEGRGTWVILLENPNPETALFSVSFTVRLVDADNRVLDTSFDFASFMLPQRKTAINGGAFDLPAPIASLELEGEWDARPVGASEVGDWIISNLEVSTDSPLTTVTGTISSTFSETMESVAVVAVFLDGQGSIVWAEYNFVSEVFPDRESFFDVTAFDVPAFETVEIYVRP